VSYHLVQDSRFRVPDSNPMVGGISVVVFRLMLGYACDQGDGQSTPAISRSLRPITASQHHRGFRPRIESVSQHHRGFRSRIESVYLPWYSNSTSGPAPAPALETMRSASCCAAGNGSPKPEPDDDERLDGIEVGLDGSKVRRKFAAGLGFRV
jgi:hypothetical protein